MDKKHVLSLGISLLGFGGTYGNVHNRSHLNDRFRQDMNTPCPYLPTVQPSVGTCSLKVAKAADKITDLVDIDWVDFFLRFCFFFNLD